MSGTISDWIIEMEKKGFSKTAKEFDSDKLEDYARLKNSGLPICDDFELPYSEFRKENSQLIDFLNEYPSFCIRAIPDTKELPRRSELEVTSFEECLKFLKREIDPNREKNYTVLINEYGQEKPATVSGIIVSKRKDVFVEIGNCGLVELSHGANPSISCAIDLSGIGHITDKMIWYMGGSRKDEKDIRNVLGHIELTRDSFNPLFMKGYFEFIILDNEEIRFLDYKINEMYLK